MWRIWYLLKRWIDSFYVLTHTTATKLVPDGRSFFIIDHQSQGDENLKHYDYIILIDRVLLEGDSILFLEKLRSVMNPDARLVICVVSSWRAMLRKIMSSSLRAREIQAFVRLAGFEPIAQWQRFAVSKHTPIISTIMTVCGQLPLINRFGCATYVVARPLRERLQEYRVSVIIPCKNEKGTIEKLVREIPVMGASTELIFVEGNSHDGTYEELLRVQQDYPMKNIKIFRQDGRGKKDAVRKGFQHASGEMLMILDSDLSVEPQALMRFYDVLKNGRGEFLNGVRLIYPIEHGAMPRTAYSANRGIARCLSWLFNQRIDDALCGTKVFFTKDYEKIMATHKEFPDIDPFGDFDLLFGAAYNNLKITDIPIHYKSRLYGHSQISRYRQVWYLIALGLYGIKKFKLRT